jgi:predicted transcriptional regulator
MTLTISLPPAVEAILREQAAVTGKDITTLVREAVEQRFALPQSEQAVVEKWSSQGKTRSMTPADREQAWQAWVAHLRNWGAAHLPAGHHVDDSRESIYEGRGE